MLNYSCKETQFIFLAFIITFFLSLGYCKDTTLASHMQDYCNTAPNTEIWYSIKKVGLF